jgi:hypothetical protein
MRLDAPRVVSPWTPLPPFVFLCDPMVETFSELGFSDCHRGRQHSRGRGTNFQDSLRHGYAQDMTNYRAD